MNGNMIDKWKRIFLHALEWKNQKPSDFVIIILLGVLFLIVAIPTDTKGTKEAMKAGKEGEVETTARTNNQKILQERDQYVEKAQKQLTDILESMEGVGRVKVMITLQDDGQIQVDKNWKTTKESKEEETVIYDVEDNKQPYVTSRQTPKIGGVLVVAQGGDNGKVNADISDAIMALFDVEVHKIKIVKMSE